MHLGCASFTPPVKWSDLPRRVDWPTWPARCPAPWPSAAMRCSSSRRSIAASVMARRRSFPPTIACQSRSARAGCRADSGKRRCPIRTCRSTSSSRPTTSSATTRRMAAACISTRCPAAPAATTPTTARASSSSAGRCSKSSACSTSGRTSCTSRLADRPGPRLPAGGLSPVAPPGLRERYEGVRTLFTIHNIAYQGCFWHRGMPAHRARLAAVQLSPARVLRPALLPQGRHSSSPTGSPPSAPPMPARSRRRTSAAACKACSTRAARTADRHRQRRRLPRLGPRHRPAPGRALHDRHACMQGKAVCKAALQKRYGLAEEPRMPLLGMVARLVDQKGVDLVLKTADAFLRGGDGGSQLVVLGEGDPVYHRLLLELRDRHPDRIGLTLGFDEPLAHQIEAGADIFLMPSQYEPSGLNQLYSLKYGTVPVVRATGGLADTVVDATPETLADGTATGFRFVPYTPGAFLTAVQRAVDLYRHEPEQWLRLAAERHAAGLVVEPQRGGVREGCMNACAV